MRWRLNAGHVRLEQAGSGLRRGCSPSACRCRAGHKLFHFCKGFAQGIFFELRLSGGVIPPNIERYVCRPDASKHVVERPVVDSNSRLMLMCALGDSAALHIGSSKGSASMNELAYRQSSRRFKPLCESSAIALSPGR